MNRTILENNLIELEENIMFESNSKIADDVEYLIEMISDQLNYTPISMLNKSFKIRILHHKY